MHANSSTAVTNPPIVLTISEGAGARAVFTGRAQGDVSRPGDNGSAAGRRTVLQLLGLDAGAGVLMEQVHGAGVAQVGLSDRGSGCDGRTPPVRGVDALVTTELDLGLVVRVADCMPVLLVAPGRGVAAVHAGWRGIVAGVVPAATAALAEATGQGPALLPDVTAVLGPGIGPCCYEVSEDVATQVSSVVPSIRAQTQWGTTAVDLQRAVCSQLAAAGIARVRRVDECTRCHSDRWFSHRAARAGLAADGRQAAAVRGAAGDHGPSPSSSLD